MKSETIGKLAEALSKAQGTMGNAAKDSQNPFFKQKYADLASVMDAIKEPLAQNGLSYVQLPEAQGESHYLTTILMHTSGEWISSQMRLIVQKNDMQGLGSAITYARRYALSAIVGITQDDDDGEMAVGRPKLPQNQKKEEDKGKETPPIIKPNGEHSGASQEKSKVATEIASQVVYIRSLQSKLGITNEEFKSMLLEQFHQETMKDLTLDQLKKISASLEIELENQTSGL